MLMKRVFVGRLMQVKMSLELLGSLPFKPRYAFVKDFPIQQYLIFLFINGFKTYLPVHGVIRAVMQHVVLII